MYVWNELLDRPWKTCNLLSDFPDRRSGSSKTDHQVERCVYGKIRRNKIDVRNHQENVIDIYKKRLCHVRKRGRAFLNAQETLYCK